MHRAEIKQKNEKTKKRPAKEVDDLTNFNYEDLEALDISDLEDSNDEWRSGRDGKGITGSKTNFNSLDECLNYSMYSLLSSLHGQQKRNKNLVTSFRSFSDDYELA